MSNDPEVDIAQAALDAPMVMAVSRQISNAKNARKATPLVVDIIRLNVPSQQVSHQYLAPGVAVLIVTANDKLLLDVRKCATEGKYEELDSLIEKIVRQFSTLNASHYAPISNSGHIVDVRIGARSIAENILIDRGASYADVYPYMGGEIARDHILSVDFPLHESKGSPGVILLLSEPVLTDVERATLAALPNGSDTIVGEGVVAFLPAAWVVARGAWAAYQIGKYLYREYKQTKAWRASRGVTQRLTEDQISDVEIPEGTTVADLLALRADIMRQRLTQLE